MKAKNSTSPQNGEDFPARIEEATQTLEDVVDNWGLLAHVEEPLRKRFLIAAGRVSRPDKLERLALSKARIRKGEIDRRDADEQILDRTRIRQERGNPIFLTPRNKAGHQTEPLHSIGELIRQRKCYVCQTPFSTVHFFYDQMCLTCGDFNHAKRSQSADLTGRVALITGARVKIGYQAAIMMLRAGCQVICLTRFPKDAARRYAAEEDFPRWEDRLEIHGIDLRHTPSVEMLCKRLLATKDRLDFLINNACQTVRRPSGFYDHLIDLEGSGNSLSSAEKKLLGTFSQPHASHLTIGAQGSSAALSQVELLAEDTERGDHLFPRGQLDQDLQQVDLRQVNSWRLKMAEVSAIELLEVQLVNAVAPFILNARLKPLMLAVPTRDKHIVNVSAMEGQFYKVLKTDRHPHTNMAKAALNMMTRTSAMDYQIDGIHMNSVDTGWVTDEDPIQRAQAKREMHRFHPPLDIVDGAARIVDPILSGLNSGEHIWGQFLKDYRITDW
jgi:NAD(P)-dependent dehydrogenase (short-subunit alcohol dehydrogenase family)